MWSCKCPRRHEGFTTAYGTGLGVVHLPGLERGAGDVEGVKGLGHGRARRTYDWIITTFTIGYEGWSINGLS